MTVSLPKYQYQNISVSDWLQSLGGVFLITFFSYLETTEEQLVNVLKATKAISAKAGCIILHIIPFFI